MAVPVVVVGASRPHPNETENGDAWSVTWSGLTCRITLVDGLGHGPDAAEAAKLAVRATAATADLPPLDALRACHTALVGSRGAAATIATIDLANRLVIYAGIGNVEARLWSRDRYRAFTPARGILGYRWPSSIKAWQEPLLADWLLLTYSDGIQNRSLPALRLDTRLDPQAVVDELLTSGARPHDDATVVAAWGTE